MTPTEVLNTWLFTTATAPVNEKLLFWNWEKTNLSREKWRGEGCRYSRAMQTQSCALGRDQWPTWSLPAWPTLGLNFEGCEQHFTTQKSHFQSCQAHTPQMSCQMALVPAFLKSQAPGAACPSEKGESYHQNRYPLLARVKPCTDQHLGATKITSDREIWLNYCCFHQVMHPQLLNNNMPQFLLFMTQFIQRSCHVLTDGGGEGLSFKNHQCIDACNSALREERKTKPIWQPNLQFWCLCGTLDQLRSCSRWSCILHLPHPAAFVGTAKKKKKYPRSSNLVWAWKVKQAKIRPHNERLNGGKRNLPGQRILCFWSR